jgi:hypothetical protein
MDKPPEQKQNWTNPQNRSRTGQTPRTEAEMDKPPEQKQNWTNPQNRSRTGQTPRTEAEMDKPPEQKQNWTNPKNRSRTGQTPRTLLRSSHSNSASKQLPLDTNLLILNDHNNKGLYKSANVGLLTMKGAREVGHFCFHLV